MQYLYFFFLWVKSIAQAPNRFLYRMIDENRKQTIRRLIFAELWEDSRKSKEASDLLAILCVCHGELGLITAHIPQQK